MVKTKTAVNLWTKTAKNHFEREARWKRGYLYHPKVKIETIGHILRLCPKRKLLRTTRHTTSRTMTKTETCASWRLPKVSIWKITIHEPCILFVTAKYNLENLQVVGLFLSSRGTYQNGWMHFKNWLYTRISLKNILLQL